MDKAQLDATIKSLTDKGYKVELPKSDNDSDIIKELEGLGYTITKPEPQPKEDSNGLLDILKQYGFKPVETKNENPAETDTDSRTNNKTETKTETATEVETKSDTETDTSKLTFFALGTPTQDTEKLVINESSILGMSSEEVVENIDSIKEYIENEGGVF